ncbi:hypothetical protein BH18ACT4_BH18ACT4_11550 [soil metagenome]
MARPVKRKPQGGRVTPKGGSVSTTRTERGTPPPATGRYTPPIPREEKVSPRWVPILMFALLGLGMLLILLNYVGIVPGFGPLPDDTSNVYLLIGLGLILAGIIAATQYH